MNIVLQSNWRLHLAIIAHRIQSDSDSRGEILDALNQRRDMRARYHNAWREVVEEGCLERLRHVAIMEMENFQRRIA